MYPIDAAELTVGDRIMLSHGDTVPCDCLVIESDEFSVSESMLTGDPNNIGKQSVGHFSQTTLSSETVCFGGSTCQSGSAYAIVLAVGQYSSQAKNQLAEEIEQDHEEDNDLLEKHANIAQILICVLIIASTLLLIHCSIDGNISWATSANIAAMCFVYGFPYILAIPSIWDVALVNACR